MTSRRRWKTSQSCCTFLRPVLFFSLLVLLLAVKGWRYINAIFFANEICKTWADSVANLLSIEISGFFCHSDFTWNQLWRIFEVGKLPPFGKFQPSNSAKIHKKDEIKFRASKCVKIAGFAFRIPKLWFHVKFVFVKLPKLVTLAAARLYDALWNCVSAKATKYLNKLWKPSLFFHEIFHLAKNS